MHFQNRRLEHSTGIVWTLNETTTSTWNRSDMLMSLYFNKPYVCYGSDQHYSPALYEFWMVLKLPMYAVVGTVQYGRWCLHYSPYLPYFLHTFNYLQRSYNCTVNVPTKNWPIVKVRTRLLILLFVFSATEFYFGVTPLGHRRFCIF